MPEISAWRKGLYRVIFHHDTRAGRAFDVALLWVILASVLAVMLESVASIRADWGPQLHALEWVLTFLFTVEYVLRLLCHPSPSRYARSFYGLIDLLAVIPSYLSLVLPGAQSLLVIRALRLLRVFRILKLGSYLDEARVLGTALQRSRRKITVFVANIITITVIVGAAMYIIEGEENGFGNIPVSVYWAIVTMTTVGYGDISPQTPLGKGLASMLMILGYGIFAVPTGIVAVELSKVTQADSKDSPCPACAWPTHDGNASFCKMCGQRL